MDLGVLYHTCRADGKTKTKMSLACSCHSLKSAVEEKSVITSETNLPNLWNLLLTPLKSYLMHDLKGLTRRRKLQQ